jgi:hypothetical protein
MNVAAAIGACAGPLIIGALIERNAHTGWRNFYVIIIFLLIDIKLNIFHSGFKWHFGE